MVPNLQIRISSWCLPCHFARDFLYVLILPYVFLWFLMYLVTRLQWWRELRPGCPLPSTRWPSLCTQHLVCWQSFGMPFPGMARATLCQRWAFHISFDIWKILEAFEFLSESAIILPNLVHHLSNLSIACDLRRGRDSCAASMGNSSCGPALSSFWTLEPCNWMQ